jgi:hypothetical protein
MARLPGIYEYLATMGAPAINLGRGVLGYQDPFLTQTMQDRMTEIEGGRTRGNVGYDEYGLVPSAGRFTGGLMDLAINRPADFALAGSIGKYDFGPEGRKGLEYNFTPDQDTGSTGSAMLDFINRGGVKGAFSRMGTAQASEPNINNTGIISASNVLPFTSMADMYDKSQIDLVDQINQRPRNIGAPMTLEETMAGSVLPPDSRNFQSIFPTTTKTPQTVKDTIASNLLYDDFTVAEEGDDLEDNAVTVDELGNLKQPSGFKDFLRTMLGFAIPGAGLFTGDRSALQGIKSLNQRIQQSDFGQATSLMDYLDMRKYGGAQGRRDAAARNMAQARGIQKKIDTGRYRRTAADNVIDRGRGESNIASRAPKGPTGAKRGIDARNKSSIDPAVGRRG